jgi:hypothetical protein
MTQVQQKAKFSKIDGDALAIQDAASGWIIPAAVSQIQYRNH